MRRIRLAIVMTNEQTHELSLPAPLPTDDDIMNTVFVSGIAPGIKDSWIQKILSVSLLLLIIDLWKNKNLETTS